MTGMGFCDYCKKLVPHLELLAHITVIHQFTPERWPDGGLVRFETLEPAGFMEDTARGFFALLGMSRWQRFKAWLRRGKSD